MKHRNVCPVCEARFRPLPFCFWHARRRCPLCGSVYRLSRLWLLAADAVVGLWWASVALLAGFGVVRWKPLGIVLMSVPLLAVYVILRYRPPLRILERSPQHGEHNATG